MASIKFPEGTTYRVEFTLKDRRTNLPLDLTDGSLTFAMYTEGAATTGVVPAFLTKTIGDGLAIISAVDGTFRLTFDPSDTVDQAGTYEYEIEFIDGLGDIYLAGEGKVIVRPARRLDA